MVEEKREKTPKKRKKNERRKDMQIITSASQTDIYLWAISMIVMAAILVVFVMTAL